MAVYSAENVVDLLRRCLDALETEWLAAEEKLEANKGFALKEPRLRKHLEDAAALYNEVMAIYRRRPVSEGSD